MAKQLSSSEGINLINIQHGVAFGAIFTSLFRQPPSSLETVGLFLPLLLYYFVDWLTVNFAREKYNFTSKFVFAGSFTIWCLAALVILSNTHNSYKYLLLSVYISGVGLYDLIGFLFNHRITLYKLSPSWFWWLLWMSGFKTILGFLLFLQAVCIIYGGGKANLSLLAIIFASIVTIFKLLRFKEIIKG